MKKNLLLLTIAMLAGSIMFLTSCKKDEEEEESPQEVIADDNTFKDFQNWVLEAQEQGPDPALGPAHQGNDSTVTRYVYFKDGQDPVNGTYPIGTMIVKESKNPDESIRELTAMVKRGNGFDPDNNDWEWFMLAPDGSIARDENNEQVRGAIGMCTSCHMQNTATDYVFSK